MSTCDANWDVDLICQHLKQSSAKVGSTGQWYKLMDPGGTLDDRSYVFDMLTNDPAHTDPNDVSQSMIPWNQLNKGIVKVFKSEYACGSVVKLAFTKYMGWKGEPRRRSMKHPRWDGLKWIKNSLAAGIPVRAYLQTRHHYVGIVGYSERLVMKTPLRFLIMDPWPGGADTGSTKFKYAGKDTMFLGEASVEDGKIVYDATKHEVTAVEGFHPF